jgi:A/G-specific adenine glycosylase
MELGATVCTPKNQRCSGCALNTLCVSRSQPAMPVSGRARINFKKVVWPLAIVRRRGKILLRRRSADGLLAGLWELPGKELERRESVEPALRAHLTELDVSLTPAIRLGEIRHSITHRRIRAPVYLFDLDARRPLALPPAHWHWIAPAKVREHAASSMTRKAVALFSSHEKSFR